MADSNFTQRLSMAARKWPWLRALLKTLRRGVWEKGRAHFFDLWRVLAPARSFRLGPPKSSFSIFQSLPHEGCRPGRVVLTDQGVPPMPTDSLMVRCGLHQHTSQPWPIFWSRHRNARLVSPSLALVDERKRLCREAVYGDLGLEDDPAWRYFGLPPAVTLPGNWTSVVSRWATSVAWGVNPPAPTFSHWLLDCLPRLALMKEFPADTGILVPDKLTGYQKESLKLLGLLDRVRYTPERHLIVENYYFSAPTGMISCFNPYGVNWLRSAFLPLADKSYRGPKRFIIHRKGKSRGILNETEVYDFFKKLGWAIIDTETLTFAQEIELFAQAEAFAGVLGSGFTNGVWSQPGCKVIALVADSWLDGWVEGICLANQLEFQWKIFPADHAMMIKVDLAELKNVLSRAGLL